MLECFRGTWDPTDLGSGGLWEQRHLVAPAVTFSSRAWLVPLLGAGFHRVKLLEMGVLNLLGRGRRLSEPRVWHVESPQRFPRLPSPSPTQLTRHGVRGMNPLNQDPNPQPGAGLSRTNVTRTTDANPFFDLNFSRRPKERSPKKEVKLPLMIYFI